MTTTLPLKSNIGRFLIVKHKDSGVLLYANCLDCVAGTDEPKRVRIQRGLPAIHGAVLMPNQYEFRAWADEDDP